MNFYTIDPSHPHLGASINVKIFPLAAAEEVGFSEVAEGYLFYGDGTWERAHRLFKEDGTLYYKIPQFTGTRLFLRFYLADSEGNGAFTPVYEHPVAFGQYAKLFEDENLQEPEIGALVLVDLNTAGSLASELSGLLRRGASSFWFRLGEELITSEELQAEIREILDSAQRLPGSYLEIPLAEEVTVENLSSLLADLKLIEKKWIRALVLQGKEDPRERLQIARELADETGLTTLALVSAREYLREEIGSDPQALVVEGYNDQTLDTAILRGLSAARGDTIWVVTEEEQKEITSEYALGTGAAHVFTRSFPSGNQTMVRPVLIDLNFIASLDSLESRETILNYSWEEVLDAVSRLGFITGLTLEQRPWKARSGIYLTEKVEKAQLERLAKNKTPVLVLSADDQEEAGDPPSLITLGKVPQSLDEFTLLVQEWFKGKVESKGSWTVISGQTQRR